MRLGTTITNVQIRSLKTHQTTTAVNGLVLKIQTQV